MHFQIYFFQETNKKKNRISYPNIFPPTFQSLNPNSDIGCHLKTEGKLLFLELYLLTDTRVFSVAAV